jgi:hypothetical protein
VRAKIIDAALPPDFDDQDEYTRWQRRDQAFGDFLSPPSGEIDPSLLARVAHQLR